MSDNTLKARAIGTLTLLAATLRTNTTDADTGLQMLTLISAAAVSSNILSLERFESLFNEVKKDYPTPTAEGVAVLAERLAGLLSGGGKVVTDEDHGTIVCTIDTSAPRAADRLAEFKAIDDELDTLLAQPSPNRGRVAVVCGKVLRELATAARTGAISAERAMLDAGKISGAAEKAGILDRDAHSALLVQSMEETPDPSAFECAAFIDKLADLIASYGEKKGADDTIAQPVAPDAQRIVQRLRELGEKVKGDHESFSPRDLGLMTALQNDAINAGYLSLRKALDLFHTLVDEYGPQGTAESFVEFCFRLGDAIAVADVTAPVSKVA